MIYSQIFCFLLENKLVKQIVNLRFLKLFGLNSMAEKKNPLKNRLNKYKNIFARKNNLENFQYIFELGLENQIDLTKELKLRLSVPNFGLKSNSKRKLE